MSISDLESRPPHRKLIYEATGEDVSLPSATTTQEIDRKTSAVRFFLSQSLGQLLRPSVSDGCSAPSATAETTTTTTRSCVDRSSLFSTATTTNQPTSQSMLVFTGDRRPRFSLFFLRMSSIFWMKGRFFRRLAAALTHFSSVGKDCGDGSARNLELVPLSENLLVLSISLTPPFWLPPRCLNLSRAFRIDSLFRSCLVQTPLGVGKLTSVFLQGIEH